MRRAAVLAALCFVASLAHASKAPEWLQAHELEAALSRSDERFPDAAAVELLRLRQVTIGTMGERDVIDRRVCHLREGTGATIASHTFAGSRWRELESLRGWIQRPGEPFERIEATVIESSYGGALYTEDQAFTLTCPRLSAGSVVAYEVHWRDSFPGAADDLWRLSGDLPVARWRYVLRLPPDWISDATRISRLVDRSEPLEPIQRLPSGAVWSGVEVDAIDPDLEFSPPDGARGEELWVRLVDPAGRAAQLRSWGAIRAWYRELSESALESAALLGEQARALAPATSLPRERIAATVDHVRRATRYVQIYLGDGSWRPHSVDEVARSGFGDCKDLSHLAVALLQQNGVEAWPALSGTELLGDVWRQAATPRVFDHCIARVRLGDGWIWFDPTAEHVPFGRIPAVLEGTWALPIEPSAGDSLLRLPVSSPEENQRHRSADLELTDGLALSGRVHESRTGHWQYAFRERFDSANAEDVARAWQERLSDDWPGARVSELEIVGWPAESETLHVRYRVHLPSAATRSGDRLLVVASPLDRRSSRWFRDAEREAPVDFGFAAIRSSRTRIVAREGWRVESLPDSADLRTPPAEFSLHSRVDDAAVRIDRRESVLRPRSVAADYADLREWDRVCVAADRERVVFIRTTP